MRPKTVLQLSAALVLMLALVSWCLPEARSQQPRRRPSRRITNPVRPQPVPTPTTNSEPALISTAEDQANSETSQTTGRTRRDRSEAEQSRETLERLTGEVTRLNRKVDDLEKQRRSDLMQERLTRAEQRAESLQQQLRDVLEKEANLQARRDQLDEQLRPENLERQTSLVGSFRPDEVRDNLRRQLENEKRRVQAQLDVLAQSRTRLETSLANADSVAARLRTQLDEETRKELEADRDEAELNAAPAPSPTPSATPPPERNDER